MYDTNWFSRLFSLEAIEKAIDECIKEHVLEEFLKKQRAEVISMSVLDFDLERQLGFARKEGIEEGEERGSDLKLISQICRKLKKNKEAAVIAEELEEDFEIVEHNMPPVFRERSFNRFS